MSDNINKFNTIVAQLLEIGEDPEEMTFWKNVFPSLSSNEQGELLAKLETELQTLKSLQ